MIIILSRLRCYNAHRNYVALIISYVTSMICNQRNSRRIFKFSRKSAEKLPQLDSRRSIYFETLAIGNYFAVKCAIFNFFMLGC